ncbi:hypothetical protein BH23BAC4_BH23BAC4_08660 [soil metagenome]
MSAKRVGATPKPLQVVVSGDRIEGSGVARTRVSGTCVHGVQEEPFRIDGTSSEGILRFTMLTDWDREPPPADVQMDETMECAIRTLREMPSVMRTLVEWGMEALTQAECPLEVPVADHVTVQECGGLSYRVKRLMR